MSDADRIDLRDLPAALAAVLGHGDPERLFADALEEHRDAARAFAGGDPEVRRYHDAIVKALGWLLDAHRHAVNAEGTRPRRAVEELRALDVDAEQSRRDAGDATEAT